MTTSTRLIYEKVKPVVVYAIERFDDHHKSVKFKTAANNEPFVTQPMKNHLADRFTIGQEVTIAYFVSE